MPLEEEEVHKEQLSGVVVPDFEKFPDYTAMEVLYMEAVGSSLWNHVDDGDSTRERNCNTFLCLPIDDVHRDGN